MNRSMDIDTLRVEEVIYKEYLTCDRKVVDALDRQSCHGGR